MGAFCDVERTGSLLIGGGGDEFPPPMVVWQRWKLSNYSLLLFRAEKAEEQRSTNSTFPSEALFAQAEIALFSGYSAS